MVSGFFYGRNQKHFIAKEKTASFFFNSIEPSLSFAYNITIKRSQLMLGLRVLKIQEERKKVEDEKNI